MSFYRILDRPLLYKFKDRILAPGAEKNFTDQILHVLDQVPSASAVLDIGCGPSSWLWKVGIQPIGLDLSLYYARAFVESKGMAINASAINLPFVSNSFGGVWSIGMFHHVPNELVSQSLGEMMRVCQSGGYVVIFDAVMPESPWHKPLAYMLRRLDRGHYVRSQRSFESLLPNDHSWTTYRSLISKTGLEMVVCYCLKD